MLTIDLNLSLEVIIPTIVAIIGGFWAIKTYEKSNKIKAAEILFNLESNFKEHIPILLDIEYEVSYREKIVKAIEAAENKTAQVDDDIIIEKIDEMLRHFLTCYFTKKLNVDDGMLDTAYDYYLKLFVRKDRPEIEKYINDYWYKVHDWAIESRKLMKVK